MFNEANRQFQNLKHEVELLKQRTNVCEYEVSRIKSFPIERIYEIEYNIGNLQQTVEELRNYFKSLNASLSEQIATLRAEMDAKTENPKQKIDLEILEEKDEFEVDPYTTPQYYLDDKKKHDYWYWNGE